VSDEGVVTVQEEVFGEIYDEEDKEDDEQGQDLIRMIDDGTYLIQVL
jgi:CBS domain containing-hemolysin-like protein